MLLKSNRLPVPPVELKKLRKSVIYFAALNLMLGLSISGGNLFIHSGLNIDNMAHVGGFACGLLFAVPMVPRIGSPRQLFERRLRVAVITGSGNSGAFGFDLPSCRHWVWAERLSHRRLEGADRQGRLPLADQAGKAPAVIERPLRRTSSPSPTATCDRFHSGSRSSGESG